MSLMIEITLFFTKEELMAETASKSEPGIFAGITYDRATKKVLDTGTLFFNNGGQSAVMSKDSLARLETLHQQNDLYLVTAKLVYGNNFTHTLEIAEAISSSEQPDVLQSLILQRAEASDWERSFADTPDYEAFIFQSTSDHDCVTNDPNLSGFEFSSTMR